MKRGREEEERGGGRREGGTMKKGGRKTQKESVKTLADRQGQAGSI
jgi:hypothetical protein